MKQILLLTIFLLFASLSYGQIAYANSNNCVSCPDQHERNHRSPDDLELKVYPNPATDHIHFNNYENTVRSVVFYNLVGRPIKRFVAVEGKNYYDLTELSRGLYLVQLMDRKGNIISTKRLNKR